ncbi:4-hydroxy-tetrahydrodipicolinate reductase [Lachnotalea sp. AF33-28]|uniref:4-hydroxy-tetrahydrodipicolinate reductase n=1 Tax=Lachnotalea sp. AF33-28 TaxID=2292046 RepID=UPI000E4EC3F1|nr:4-hydroxy-tetrahydrodipicolinate reductase [Lachnotalea sp. AF33-28]RHP32331.1 4-hydroxy-tetrahydrodipicolinate reductase [Lachnotalea sp. AF33-28]
MVRIIMHGCNGKMGQVITGLADRDGDVEIVAGVDPMDSGMNTYPVFPSIDLCDVDADVIIDFASAKAVDALLDYSVRRQIPVVLCTTGLSEEQLAHVKRASASVAVLKSANMSLGINVISKLLKEAARTLADAGFDIEIVEKHHNQKVDAPSGTALALADAINEEMGGRYEYVYDRSGVREKRSSGQIGIQAVRGGSIVGEHEVIFAGTDEVIEIKHTAYSKAIFAKGALQAAKYLAGKPAGWYEMKDVIG